MTNTCEINIFQNTCIFFRGQFKRWYQLPVSQISKNEYKESKIMRAGMRRGQILIELLFSLLITFFELSFQHERQWQILKVLGAGHYFKEWSQNFSKPAPLDENYVKMSRCIKKGNYFEYINSSKQFVRKSMTKIFIVLNSIMEKETKIYFLRFRET